MEYIVRRAVYSILIKRERCHDMEKRYREKHCVFGLSSSSLKIIAIIAMVIDHFAYAVYRILPGYDLQIYNRLRDMGRIAFPVFAFLIVEGFVHTGNVKKYIQRLFLFALLSEVTYDIAFHDTCFYIGKQNVFITLLLGLTGIHGIHRYREATLLNFVKQIVIGLVAMGLAEAIHCDYGMYGVLLMILLYYTRFYAARWLPFIGSLAAIFILEQPYAILAFLLIFFYNGKRGLRLKYTFYFIYPVHLLVIGFIRFICLQRLGQP